MPVDTSNIELREVLRFKEPEFTQLVQSLLLDDALIIPESTWLRDWEIEATNQLGQALRQSFALRIGAFRGDKLIGWAHGFQESADSFIMATSAVLPAYRRQGVYTRLARRVLERTREAGFQVVYSKHGVMNNPILIAKLKLGFTIAGMEVSDIHGLLVRMRYLFNERRTEVAEVRVGTRRADSKILPLLGLREEEEQ